MKYVITICLVLVRLFTFAQVVIPFGTENKIVYDLNKGTWSLTMDEQLIFENVYAVGQDIDSRTAVKRSYTVTQLPDDGTLYTITSGRLQQLFYTYKHKYHCVIVLRVAGKACNYLSPLNADKIEIGKKALNVPFDNDMWVRYAAPDISQAAFTGSEVTALYDDRHGVAIGSLNQDVWKTGLQVRDNGLKVYCGFTDSTRTHDKKQHGRVQPVDGYCTSAPIYIGYDEDWRTAMEEYTFAFGPRHIKRIPQQTPVCWNSWGVIQTKIDLAKAKGVVDFFHDSCVGYRNRDGELYIDLDSYWDNMSLVQLTEFAAYCKEKGFKPGIYWAPFVDWGKNDRPLEGSTYTYGQTWTKQDGKYVDMDGGRAMDPTHPGTKDRIAHYMHLFREMGYQMVKIDFLVHGALEGDRFYDKKVTTGMQAFRKGMEWLDSMAGKDMMLYAAISPNVATRNYVHIRRIACDAFSSLENTEYTLNSTAYGWWQSYLYYHLDADHVVFKDASFNANKARVASAIVTGGTMVVGDDYATDGPWKEVAKKLLQDKDLLQCLYLGQTFRPVDGNKIFTLNDDYIAIFNYDNKEQEYSIPMDKPGTATELFSKEKVPVTNVLRVKVEAGSAAIYKIGI